MLHDERDYAWKALSEQQVTENNEGCPAKPPSSASAPFLTLVRLRGTACLKTFAQNLTSQTFGSFSKLIITLRAKLSGAAYC